MGWVVTVKRLPVTTCDVTWRHYEASLPERFNPSQLSLQVLISGLQKIQGLEEPVESHQEDANKPRCGTSTAVVPSLFSTRDRFCGRQFLFTARRWGVGFRIIQVHYIYCALYFYYISSTSDHQTLDPGGGGTPGLWDSWPPSFFSKSPARENMVVRR